MKIEFQPLPSREPDRPYEGVIHDAYHETWCEIWYNRETHDQLNAFYMDPAADHGGTRVAVSRVHSVVKIPRTISGCWGNVCEALSYNHALDLGIRALAPCRLIHVKGLPILVMERLLPRPYSGYMADWLYEHWGDQHDWGNVTDGGQVGAGHDERLYIYDYAHLASFRTGGLDTRYEGVLREFDKHNDIYHEVNLLTQT